MEAAYTISGVAGGIRITEVSRVGDENGEGVCKDQ